MPSSDPEFITDICHRILRLQPDSVLDIGAGDGLWGFLARRYCDTYRAIDPTLKQTRIDCIEIFGAYITDIHRQVYNHIYTGDCLDLVPSTGKHYDLIICGDVLEHMERAKGRKLLDLIREHGRHAFVITPVKWTPSSNHFGNEHEIHRELWTATQLAEYGSVITAGNKHLCIFW